MDTGLAYLNPVAIHEIFNSDSDYYWGSNVGNDGGKATESTANARASTVVVADIAAAGNHHAQVRNLNLNQHPCITVKYGLPYVPFLWDHLFFPSISGNKIIFHVGENNELVVLPGQTFDEIRLYINPWRIYCEACAWSGPIHDLILAEV